jgi:hypothetical protein
MNSLCIRTHQSELPFTRCSSGDRLVKLQPSGSVTWIVIWQVCKSRSNGDRRGDSSVIEICDQRPETVCRVRLQDFFLEYLDLFVISAPIMPQYTR